MNRALIVFYLASAGYIFYPLQSENEWHRSVDFTVGGACIGWAVITSIDELRKEKK